GAAAAGGRRRAAAPRLPTRRRRAPLLDAVVSRAVRRQLSIASVHPAGRRRTRAPDRVRQRREPAARARRRPWTRNRRPPGDRRRASLIAAEVALSLLLLVGAGLLIRSALALQQVNPGFDPHGVLSARIALPQTSYGDPARARDTFQRLADDVAHAPGVAHS